MRIMPRVARSDNGGKREGSDLKLCASKSFSCVSAIQSANQAGRRRRSGTSQRLDCDKRFARNKIQQTDLAPYQAGPRNAGRSLPGSRQTVSSLLAEERGSGHQVAEWGIQGHALESRSRRSRARVTSSILVFLEGTARKTRTRSSPSQAKLGVQ